MRNTTSITAKFLDKRLRFNGDFTYRKKTNDITTKKVRTPIPLA